MQSAADPDRALSGNSLISGRIWLDGARVPDHDFD